MCFQCNSNYCSTCDISQNRWNVVSCNLLSWPTKEWLWQGHLIMTQFEWDLVATSLAPPITKHFLAMLWDIHELLIVEVIFTILLNKVKNNIMANLVSRTQFFSFQHCQIIEVESKGNKGDGVWPKEVASIVINGTKASCHLFLHIILCTFLQICYGAPSYHLFTNARGKIGMMSMSFFPSYNGTKSYEETFPFRRSPPQLTIQENVTRWGIMVLGFKAPFPTKFIRRCTLLPSLNCHPTL